MPITQATAQSGRLKSLTLHHYRAFETFRVEFSEHSLLVGGNNAGKSTIIEAVRFAAAFIDFARARKPSLTRQHHGAREAYPIPVGLTDARTESIHHEFRDNDAVLEVIFDDDQRVVAVWPAGEEQGFFYLTLDVGAPTGPVDVRLSFPTIGVVPKLGPIEQSEELLDEKYVMAHLDTRLASRHFRNQVALLDTGDSKSFLKRVAEWAPEISLAPLQVVSGRPSSLDIYYRERGRRIPKELCWSGDGLQVWLQLLFHLNRLSKSPIVVLDEPDNYLHPDMQRRLIRLLESHNGQTVAATHSVEMVSQAVETSILLVDKMRSKAEVVGESGMAELSTVLGSDFNLDLVKAIRSKVALCVEGLDLRVLRLLAERADLPYLAREAGLAPIRLGGFSNWPGVVPFEWLQRELLKDTVRVIVWLDRDYRTDSCVAKVEKELAESMISGHIWRRKEVENYLLEIPILASATGLHEGAIQHQLDLIVSELAPDIEDQIKANFLRELPPKLDDSTRLRLAREHFDEIWADKHARMHRAPGKEVIRRLNSWLQASGHPTLTPHKIAVKADASTLPDELLSQLQLVESMLDGTFEVEPRR